MMKVRRYLRGSGRVLAFVFIASVIWLLFDMAALRLSINDVNSQLLKERVVKEREVFRLEQQRSRASQGVRRGFRNPVQRVDLGATKAWRGPLGPDMRVAQVYRQGGKADSPKQSPPAKKKKAVDLDLTNAEQSRVGEDSDKVMLPVTKVPAGPQEDKGAPLPTSKKVPDNAGHVVPAADSKTKTDEKVKGEPSKDANVIKEVSDKAE